MNKLHDKAMELVDDAALARLRGDLDEYERLTLAAYDHESEAAWKLAGELKLEPTRSVMFRSAASLALEAKKIREAEQLISAALAGAPPEQIANELRDLLEDVYFNRHLDLRGITLSPGELQMTIEGGKALFTKAIQFTKRGYDMNHRQLVRDIRGCPDERQAVTLLQRRLYSDRDRSRSIVDVRDKDARLTALEEQMAAYKRFVDYLMQEHIMEEIDLEGCDTAEQWTAGSSRC